MANPRPKPTAIRILEGNPSRRPLPQREPKPDRTMPVPPVVLGAIAMEEWHRMAPELQRIGVLTMADRTNLAAYCKLYERWVLAEQKVNEEGLTVETFNGYVIHNPHIGIANTALGLMLKYMIELGLTPSSRTRIAKGETNVDDPLEQFLKGKPKPRGQLRK